MRAHRVFKCFSFTYVPHLRKHFENVLQKHLLASTPRLIFALLCAFTNKLIRLFFMREIEFCYFDVEERVYGAMAALHWK